MITKICGAKPGFEVSNYAEFICETTADIPNLPNKTKCAIGSKAVIASVGEVYILLSTGWTYLCDASNSPISGEIASVSEVDTYLDA